MPRKALATLVIGDRYKHVFNYWYRPGWEAYCRRYGLDLVVVETPLDTSPRGAGRSPSWQKLLIHTAPGLENCEQIAWVDCDIAIAPHSPNIFDLVPVHKVGTTNDHATPTREDHRLVTERAYRQWDAAGIRYVSNLTAQEVYANVGIHCDYEDVVQAGMFVFSPAHHAELMERVYRTCEDSGDNGLNHEMRFFSYELIKAGLVEWLSVKFNMMWTCYQALYYPFLELPEQLPGRLPFAVKKALSKFLRGPCVRCAFNNNYFLHFAGRSKDYQYLERI